MVNLSVEGEKSIPQTKIFTFSFRDAGATCFFTRSALMKPEGPGIIEINMAGYFNTPLGSPCHLLSGLSRTYTTSKVSGYFSFSASNSSRRRISASVTLENKSLNFVLLALSDSARVNI